MFCFLIWPIYTNQFNAYFALALTLAFSDTEDPARGKEAARQGERCSMPAEKCENWHLSETLLPKVWHTEQSSVGFSRGMCCGTGAAGYKYGLKTQAKGSLCQAGYCFLPNTFLINCVGKSKFLVYSIDSSNIYLIYIGFALVLLQVSGPFPTVTSPSSQNIYQLW